MGLYGNKDSELRLPKFIYKAITSHYTSLGANPALPDYGEFGFEYKVVKDRFKEVSETLDGLISDGVLESKDVDYLLTKLSKLIVECMKEERPIRKQLEKLCENVVYKVLAVPYETIILKCHLVDKVSPKNPIRVLPEDEGEYTFDDVDDMELSKKSILKRRLINSLVQGASFDISVCRDSIDMILDELVTLNSELFSMYSIINAIEQYILFVKEEKIDKDNPMQNSYVSVKLGKKGEKTVIESQGLYFMALLRETLRGFFELFSSHGLPNDTKKAMMIIKNADFLVAEPWDMRVGVGLWRRIVKNFEEGSEKYAVNMLPYIFLELCSLETDEFNDIVQNFLIGTKKGKEIASDIVNDISYDREYQEFKDRIQHKNDDVTLISDDCFSKDELNDYVIEEDGGDVDNENCSIEYLLSASPDDIDIDAVDNGSLMDLYATVNGCKFGREQGLLFMAEPKFRIQQGAYQLHITIPEEIRGRGLAYKLYYSFLTKCGDIVSLYSNRNGEYAKSIGKFNGEDSAIDKIFIRLSQLPNVTVDGLFDNEGNQMGVIACLKDI